VDHLHAGTGSYACLLAALLQEVEDGYSGLGDKKHAYLLAALL
jgi:hypothetical protein